MAIPDFQACMLALLRETADGNDHAMRDIVSALAIQFELTQQQLNELLPSGSSPVFANRVAWARLHLKKAGLLESPRRGAVRITAAGRQVLASPPDVITVKFLKQFPAYREGMESDKRDSGDELTTTETGDQTPEEALELANQSIRRELSQELLAKIHSCSPAFFEQLVVELLVKMGYGGSRKDAGERVGQSGDGGIDGVIKEDRLGLDAIYIQAKRWQGSVGRPEIQKFVGALSGQRARKGVFITTSVFTAEAKEYATLIETKVVLIDGSLLANLMIDFDVGVTTHATYIVKRIDSDYFDEA